MTIQITCCPRPLRQLRAWAEVLATPAGAVAAVAIDAADDGDSYDDCGDDEETRALYAVLVLPPGHVLQHHAVRTLLTRICEHVEAILQLASPDGLLIAARQQLAVVVADAVAEVGPRGVTLREFHDTAYGCVFEVMWKLLVES